MENHHCNRLNHHRSSINVPLYINHQRLILIPKGILPTTQVPLRLPTHKRSVESTMQVWYLQAGCQGLGLCVFCMPTHFYWNQEMAWWYLGYPGKKNLIPGVITPRFWQPRCQPNNYAGTQEPPQGPRNVAQWTSFTVFGISISVRTALDSTAEPSRGTGCYHVLFRLGSTPHFDQLGPWFLVELENIKPPEDEEQGNVCLSQSARRHQLLIFCWLMSCLFLRPEIAIKWWGRFHPFDRWLPIVFQSLLGPRPASAHTHCLAPHGLRTTPPSNPLVIIFASQLSRVFIFSWT